MVPGPLGCSRVQAANELARLRIALGDRFDPDLARSRRRPAPARDAPGRGGRRVPRHHRGAVGLRLVAAHDRADAGAPRAGSGLCGPARRRARGRRGARGGAHEPESGLPTPEFLARWAGSGGRAGALPIGLAVFDLPALDDAVGEYGQRRAFHAARQVAAALSEPLGPVDAAVRLSAREFALVVPGASPRHLELVAAAAAEQLELFSEGYPTSGWAPGSRPP